MSYFLCRRNRSFKDLQHPTPPHPDPCPPSHHLLLHAKIMQRHVLGCRRLHAECRTPPPLGPEKRYECFLSLSICASRQRGKPGLWRRRRGVSWQKMITIYLRCWRGAYSWSGRVLLLPRYTNTTLPHPPRPDATAVLDDERLKMRLEGTLWTQISKYRTHCVAGSRRTCTFIASYLLPKIPEPRYRKSEGRIESYFSFFSFVHLSYERLMVRTDMKAKHVVADPGPAETGPTKQRKLSLWGNCVSLSHCFGERTRVVNFKYPNFTRVPEPNSDQWQHFLIITAVDNSHRAFGSGPSEHGRLKPGSDWLRSGRLSGSPD